MDTSFGYGAFGRWGGWSLWTGDDGHALLFWLVKWCRSLNKHESFNFAREDSTWYLGMYGLYRRLWLELGGDAKFAAWSRVTSPLQPARNPLRGGHLSSRTSSSQRRSMKGNLNMQNDIIDFVWESNCSANLLCSKSPSLYHNDITPHPMQ